MDAAHRLWVTERSIGRRTDDSLLREQIHKYDQLFKVGQIITSEMNMDVLFDVIMHQTNEIMDSERSTVFLHDDKSGELWSLVATGVEKNEIRFPCTQGLAGWVFQQRKPLIINDPYNDSRFYPEVDRKTGFRTRSIICVPIINRKNDCTGVLQVLNKRQEGFSEKDEELLATISNYVAIALENAKLYEELRLMNKAKERVINHLSHELKTPLALISGVFVRVEREFEQARFRKLEKAIKRGKRSVNRLRDLEEKIEDILENKSIEEKAYIIGMIEDAASFVEELHEDNQQGCALALEKINNRIESLFALDPLKTEKIELDTFLHDICDEAESSLGGRELRISRKIQPGLCVVCDRGALRKVCGGLLKNAVENTPDEGRIEIKSALVDGLVSVECRDYGVGITDENQKIIFTGFFHTQDTELYSSKRPYHFNAGGAGADLLRARCFSEKLSFSLDFQSTRCAFSPSDMDLCPGRISICDHVADAAACETAGGSVFSLRFKEEK